MTRTFAALALAVLALVTLSGCLADDGASGSGSAFTPEPTYDDVQPTSATGLEAVAQLMIDADTPFPSGAGIWVFGDYVFGSALGNRFFIADVSDPEAPELVYQPPENSETFFARDADLIAHDDGRRTLVLATQNDGMHVWDVTDVRDPEWLARVDVTPNHNIAVVPGTELVFNSQSGGVGGTNELIDVSNPRFPVVLGTYGTHGCHDIAFFGAFHSHSDGMHGDDKFRAYCAGIDRTEIWNLDNFDVDAGNFGIELVSTIEGVQNSPVVGSPVFASYPLRTLHHLAMVNNDATVLIVGDEHNGGGSPGACFLYEDTTGLSTPFGALWFYDISDESNPTLLSWISPPTEIPDVPPALDPGNTDPTNPLGVLNNVPNCTAHFGTVVPGEEKLVMSWYSAGILLIDFSNPEQPRILDQVILNDTNMWDARIQDGYVFSGDIRRGMDVYKLV